MLPNAIDRLCDSLTVALCSVEALGQEGSNTPKRVHLDRAEKAIEQAGKAAWEINALYKRSSADIQILLAPQG